MNIPAELKYTKDHEWIKIEGDNAIVGVTDFAQKELGDIVFVEVDTVDQELNAGEVFGTVEAVKTVSDLYLPLSGTITEYNDDLGNAPESINQDPYGKGWIVKMKIKSQDEIANLLDSKAYESLVS